MKNLNNVYSVLAFVLAIGVAHIFLSPKVADGMIQVDGKHAICPQDGSGSIPDECCVQNT